MGIRSHGNRKSQYMTSGVTYSDGKSPRGISGGKSGTGGLKAKQKLTADANRTPDPKGAAVYKHGGRS